MKYPILFLLGLIMLGGIVLMMLISAVVTALETAFRRSEDSRYSASD
jgi:hypothetical protein